MTTATSRTVNTVLGPVPADDLGVVAIHEALLSVVPGAEHAYDISMDRAEIFEVLAGKLAAFRAAGGRTVVDSTGMFHGRDVKLYEALSRSTGVHVVASTGLGPEEDLGGYFLTPQTDPPTPWPAEKFADLFGREVTEGMVVPRVERRRAAGLVATCATRGGPTPTDESLFRGAARAAVATGVPVSIRYGADPLAELQLLLDEGLPADRVVVGNLDRTEAVAAGWPAAVAERGAYVAIDHVGRNDSDHHIRDAERADLVAQLVAAGHAHRVLLSGNAIGVAKGHPDYELPYAHVLTAFAPLLTSHGVADEDVQQILVANPRDLLAVR
ncbi:aryldialkylphosphatase [Geodermatophilus sabuli]|uniref:Phosphotriesterase-related protein n=1 Tax=Geodermatophilus sabuli TaxID=1564158 RepID=A0A285EDV3_9ACTN|nr:aryldialkylphosphatase [Geodermatophilus sabuli]MBB3084347.1 phosphotriesterase-related protein [Geodermatophilus sabuli]SNX96384.1 phosphotriesterase-related protein [Geodermatophilus sabuli]